MTSPDQLLTEYGLRRGAATAPSYRCSDPQSVLVPVAEVTAPVRKLNEDALRRLLRGVRDGDDLPDPELLTDYACGLARLNARLDDVVKLRCTKCGWAATMGNLTRPGGAHS